MSLIIATKRHLFVIAVVAGFALPWSLHQLYADSKQMCDLPMTAPTSEGAQQNDQSPPNQQEGVAVLHQEKFILCLPEPAAEAHVRHGDTRLGPCDKHGRVK
jgi:hypothetical protein